MKRDELEQILNSDIELKEKITQILNKHNSEKEEIKHDDQSDLIKELKGQIEELKTETENLKNTPADDSNVNDLKQQLLDLQEQLKQEKINNAIEVGIAGAGIKNNKLAELLIKSLNRDEIKIDDSGKVIGINEQIQVFKEDEAFKSLFKPTDIKPSEYVPKEGAAVKDTKTQGAKLAEKVLAERQKKDKARQTILEGIK